MVPTAVISDVGHRVGGFLGPKRDATHFCAQLGLSDKGHAIK